MSQNKENVIQHSWGYELTWAKTDKYCGKIFYFNEKGSKTPFFFNSSSDKTFFVSLGSVTVRWIDTKTGNIMQSELKEGQVWHCPALQPCSFESLIAESSLHVATSYSDNDTHIIIRSENF